MLSTYGLILTVFFGTVELKQLDGDDLFVSYSFFVLNLPIRFSRFRSWLMAKYSHEKKINCTITDVYNVLTLLVSSGSISLDPVSC